jgi:oligosaccharide repeat unit polymerase
MARDTLAVEHTAKTNTARPAGRIVLTRKHVVCAALYALLLAFPLVVPIVSPSTPDQLVPPFYVFALWVLPILIFAGLKNVYSQVVAIVWILWYFVGCVNLVASYHYYGSYYLLDAEPVALVYLAFTFAFVVGMYLYERVITPILYGLQTRRRSTTDRQLGRFYSPFAFLLLIFPFFWFASVYRSLGHIPILGALQGYDITSELYTLGYGRLYGYALINVLSMIVALEMCYAKTRTRWFYLGLLIVFAFFIISTGKRHWVVIFILAALVYLIRTKRITLTRIVVAVCLMMGLYIGLQIARQGLSIAKYASISGRLILVGSEYRAFAYVVNHLQPGDILNYDWGSSTVASMINSAILKLVGLNKDELVYLGSAYSWRYIFSTEYGIRSGIVSELYMAYGFSGVLIVLVFGMLTGWIGQQIHRTRSKNALVFLATAYGTLLLSVVGQTTDTAGSLTILLYAWIAYWVIRALAPNRRTTPIGDLKGDSD